MVHVLFCFVFRVFRTLLCENESKMLKIAHQEILKSFYEADRGFMARSVRVVYEVFRMELDANGKGFVSTFHDLYDADTFRALKTTKTVARAVEGGERDTRSQTRA